MNKIKLSIASILFLFQFYDVNAQWFVGGNTLSASNQKFGSLNSYDVNVITNGSPIFDFTTNGDIDYKNSIRGIMHLGRYSFVLPAPAGGNSRNTFVGITNNSLLQPGFRNSMFGYGAGTNLGLINLKDSANTFLGTNAGTLNYGTALQAMLFNTFVGYAASGNSNFPTQSNTFVGSFAGEQNLNNDNCFFGFKTGQVNKGAVNTFVGILAGLNNDTASLNTFLGGNAGRFNRAGYANVFTGVSSGASNISGSLNTAIGYATLSGNTSSSIGSSFQNTLLGAFAGSQMNASSNNVMLGFQAGTSAKNTQNNVLIGMQSGYSLAALSNTDNNNVFIGHQSGQAFQGGGLNTLLGTNTIANNGISNAAALGANAHVVNSNQLILGNNIFCGIGLSADAAGPQNWLEINTANLFNTNNGFGSATGFSGLRFRDLTQNSTPQASNGLALSVDANGDVILVPDQVGGSAGASLGNPCNSNPVPLNTDWEIPFVDPSNPNIQNSMYMSGQSDMSANNPADLGIGYTCGTPLQAKLDVYNYTHNTASPITPFYTNAYAGRFIHDGVYNDLAGITDMVGVLAESKILNNFTSNNVYVFNASRNIGSYNTASGNRIYNIGSVNESKQLGTTIYQYGTGSLGIVTGADLQGDGVLGIAHDNTRNIGVHGVAAVSVQTGNANVATNTSVGGLFMTYDPASKVFNPMNNSYYLNSALSIYGAHIGVYGGVENSSSSSINTTSLTGLYAGVYGEAASKSNYWAGYFNGNVGTTAGFFQVSDSIVKTNVVNLKSDSSLHILAQLHPKTYTLDSANYPSLGLNNQPQIGLFAQEVERVIPSAVRQIHHPATVDSAGNVIIAAYDVKGLNYLQLIPVLISAIKSLDSTNKSLQNQINAITAAQTGARSAAASPSNVVAKGTEVHLSDLEIVLNQNSPNPFAEQTIISYIIPDNVKDANIVFYTLGGTVLKNIRITERGQGQMTVYAENLSAGMYTYSLVADGNIVATKKMICEKK